MRIAYIADHRGKGNDDEGSIAHGFKWLGHEVVKIQEHHDYKRSGGCDFALFHHHWKQPGMLAEVEIPKVYWFFDLIHHHLLPGRHVAQLERFDEIADIGFCTDGYWAGRSPKAHHLMQGADARLLDPPQIRSKSHAITFAGSMAVQSGRKQQYNQLKDKYGSLLQGFTRSAHWVYRKKFADLVARSKIMISLKSPTKDNYWSNRVFVIAGFGGFQIHPYCSELAKYYEEGREIVFYRSQRELYKMIDHYLPRDKERNRIGYNAYERTLREHTYTHRCGTIINTVERVLGIS